MLLKLILSRPPTKQRNLGVLVVTSKVDKIPKKIALVYGGRRSGILHKRLELQAKKKVFSENQTKKNHSSHEKLAIWRRVNKLGEKMATGRTDQIMYTLIRNMRFILYEMT